MRARGEKRFVVDLDSLRQWDALFARRLLRRASEFIPDMSVALREYVESAAQQFDAKVVAPQQRQTGESDVSSSKWSLGFTGSFGANHVNPRTLRSAHLWSLICVEGMVTKCSTIHPRLLKSVHYCEKTGEVITKSYPDETATYGASGAPASTFYPTKDSAGNPLVTEFGECVFRDSQTAVVQEMPEQAPAGQLPRSVTVVLDDDLVDRVKPGDRVQIVGVFVAMPHEKQGKGDAGGASATTFKTLLVANNVQQVLRDASTPKFTEVDVRNIRQVAQSPGVVDRMSASLAPSIYGHDAVKRAMLLQLMGGQEKTTRGGLHLRGDIHLLLVGDPSVAKSQLLRYVLNVAPLAVSTNARGASGVGLTAAVVADPETHERALEAGAMVLADRGVVCIDEFDKMDPTDRAALHEVMEQQTVTIQKAGVHASLNARCSVFAAANPIYGSYNRQKSVVQNIGFPSTLLSRFDALFVLLDPADARRDRVIAEHVLRMHREGNHVPLADAAGASARKVAGAAGAVVSLEELAGGPGSEQEEATPIYAQRAQRGDDPQARVFSVPFIRKYILYARSRVFPRMTPEAGAILVERFTEFRQRAAQQLQHTQGGPIHRQQATLPITARMLESLVRLSEARARCRLSPTVTTEDADAAVALLKFALYNEGTGAPEPLQPPPAAAVDSSQSQSQSQSQPQVPQPSQTPSGKKRRRPESRDDEVRRIVNTLFQKFDTVPVERINAELGGRVPPQQVVEVLRAMEGQSLLSLSEGIVFKPTS